MKRLTHVFFHWFPLGVAIIFVFGFIYAGLQQEMRQSLNDPQIALARDIQKSVEAGELQPPQIRKQYSTVDIENSLSSFVIFYDESGNVLDSSALLDEKAPRVPQGVLDYAKSHEENRVTWEPKKGTRIALVVRPLKVESGWFVAVGRNMSEVESRIQIMTLKLFIALLLTLLGTYAADVVGDEYRRRQMRLNKNK